MESYMRDCNKSYYSNCILRSQRQLEVMHYREIGSLGSNLLHIAFLHHSHKHCIKAEGHALEHIVSCCDFYSS